MENQLDINKNGGNLLHNDDFLSSLEFEAQYAQQLRGGSYPAAADNTGLRRLTDPVNIFSSREQKELVYKFFNGKN